ncbi:MAG: XRE family transcriptional regulator [Alysiella sp.]|uniref:XRE family transcriptional regulator n=1 Tax=Alysiella sp. TaxID=1872483 RepID=UPI0026DD8A52|nr:XRE family transcriptional regulator [Alysiella sp.]MDO4434003.1 XRE family transcriptional regulator [Alysiella sp.]
MNAEKIYQELNRKGFDASMIAEAIEVLPQSVAVVIRKGKGSRRIAAAIAAVLERPIEEVFPFYGEKAEKLMNRKNQVLNLKEKLRALNV